jgi:hypothetical protein
MADSVREPHGGFVSLGNVHSTKGWSLAKPGSRYLLELATFCDLIRHFEMTATDWASQWVSDNEHHLSDSDREQFRVLLDKFIYALQEAKKYQTMIAAGEKPELPEGAIRESVEAADVTSKPADSADAMFIDLVRKMIENVNLNRSELAARAYLITAVSSFEILFGSVIRSVYDRNPTALDQSEYRFTLEELTEFASIEDARAALVSRKVDMLLMESVDNWSKWLDRTVNIEFQSVIIDWPMVREIFARRNVLVHADGRVTSRYIRDMRSVSRDTSNVNVGDMLGVSQTYVQESLERLIAFGLLMTYAVWMRLYKAEKDEGALWLMDNQDQLIDRKL